MKTYTEIDPQKWQRIQSTAEGHGLNLSAPAGRGNAYGVTLDYKYDAQAQTLNVQIVHHPFFITVETALKTLDSIILSA